MSREKMPLENRAKQFLPFDAVKGLQAALRLKEYEVESVEKGKVSETEAALISSTLSALRKGDEARVRYYEDGHYKTVEGKTLPRLEEGYLLVGETKVELINLFGIELISSR